jgi:hypothetical protein
MKTTGSLRHFGKNLNWRFLIFPPKKKNWNWGFFDSEYFHSPIPKFSKNQNQRTLKKSDDHPTLVSSLKDMIQ